MLLRTIFFYTMEIKAERPLVSLRNTKSRCIVNYLPVCHKRIRSPSFVTIRLLLLGSPNFMAMTFGYEYFGKVFFDLNNRTFLRLNKSKFYFRNYWYAKSYQVATVQ